MKNFSLHLHRHQVEIRDVDARGANHFRGELHVDGEHAGSVSHNESGTSIVLKNASLVERLSAALPHEGLYSHDENGMHHLRNLESLIFHMGRVAIGHEKRISAL